MAKIAESRKRNEPYLALLDVRTRISRLRCMLDEQSAFMLSSATLQEAIAHASPEERTEMAETAREAIEFFEGLLAELTPRLRSL